MVRPPIPAAWVDDRNGAGRVFDGGWVRRGEGVVSEVRAPSAFRVEQAMAAAGAMRQSILADDPDLAADETALRDLLDGETDVYDVLRRMVRFVLDAESLADAAGERVEKLNARKARFQKRANLGRGAVLAMMDALGERKLPDAEFTVTLRDGTPGVFVTDEAAIPEQFVKVTRAPMKAEIGKALKAGQEVPGATLANGMPTLAIKAT